MSFSERGGFRRTPPPRTKREEAPDDLRLALFDLLVEGRGVVGAYSELCAATHKLADPDIWGDRFARQPALEMVAQLEWFEVFDLLEKLCASAKQAETINQSFVRCGLAYEAAEVGWGEFKILDYDPEGDQFEVAGDEQEALSALDGRFEPVKDQYLRALNALRARPADDEKAISEALGGLEAVARILGGGQDFGPNISKLFAGSPKWANALAAALKSLYGYGSQVPGARHGRYTDPTLEHEDAQVVVRMCGAAIVYLIAGERAQRWS